jgi:hypothetical protein
MLFSEMPCLALQKAMFRRPKGHLLQAERARFAWLPLYA